VLRGVQPPSETISWSEIGGLADVKARLSRAVLWPLSCSDAMRRLGVRPPSGVLLYGPPGCSKTSLARAVAGSAAATFLHLSGAEIYSPYVGEAERALRDFFARGRACAPAILFLDEIDAIVGKRDGSGGQGSADGVQLRVLSTLLNEMDGVEPLSQVVLVGATNRLDLIDDALLRPGRFDELLQVAPPDEIGRLQVLAIHTKGMPLSSDVQLGQLAARSAGCSGAQLHALCREAAMHALRERIDAPAVCARHFEAAARDVLCR